MVASVLALLVSVLAYGGPGSVISGLGTLLAAIGAVLVALLGFVWYPLKRLYRTFFAEEQEQSVQAEPSAE